MNLIEKAKSVIRPKIIANKKLVADVGAALMTDKGNIYTGVCIDTNEGSGICAERNAMANMIIVSVLSFRTNMHTNYSAKVIENVRKLITFAIQMANAR